MRFLQITFSMLLACMIGFSNPSSLAVVIIGALLPDIDDSDRSYSEGMTAKGLTHSLLFAVIFFVFAIFYQPLFLIGVGVLGHIVIELFSKQVGLQIFWPFSVKVHVPIINQYKSTMTIISVIILGILFVFFIDLYSIIDIGITYIQWVKCFLLWILDIIQYVFFRLSTTL